MLYKKELVVHCEHCTEIHLKQGSFVLCEKHLHHEQILLSRDNWNQYRVDSWSTSLCEDLKERTDYLKVESTGDPQNKLQKSLTSLINLLTLVLIPIFVTLLNYNRTPYTDRILAQQPAVCKTMVVNPRKRQVIAEEIPSKWYPTKVNNANLLTNFNKNDNFFTQLQILIKTCLLVNESDCLASDFSLKRQMVFLLPNPSSRAEIIEVPSVFTRSNKMASPIKTPPACKVAIGEHSQTRRLPKAMGWQTPRPKLSLRPPRILRCSQEDIPPRYHELEYRYELYVTHETDTGDVITEPVAATRAVFDSQTGLITAEQVKKLLKTKTLAFYERSQISAYIKHTNSAERQWIKTEMMGHWSNDQCLQTMSNDYRPLYDAALQIISQPATLEKLADSTNSTHQARLETYKSCYLNSCLQCSVPIARLEKLVHDEVPVKSLEILELNKPKQVTGALKRIQSQQKMLSEGQEQLVVETYQGDRYFKSCVANLKLTAEMTELPYDLVHFSLKKQKVLVSQDLLRFCFKIPYGTITSKEFELPASIYFVECHLVTNKLKHKVGISNEPIKRFRKFENQPKVERINPLNIINCARLDAYIIEQATFNLFQVHFELLHEIGGGQYEGLDSKVPTKQVISVMETLKESIDSGRLIVDRTTHTAEQRKTIQEKNNAFHVERFTPRSHLAKIAKVLCKENNVDLDSQSVVQFDFPYYIFLGW